MCKKCKNKGYIILENGDTEYCKCKIGKRLEEIENKRSQKNFGDNY